MMIALDLGELAKFAYSESANLALLGAIGVIGYQLYSLERRYNKDKKKQAFDEARSSEAIAESRILLEKMKNEGVRLQKERGKAQEVGDNLSVIIDQAEAEAENSEKITRELRMAMQVADRTCSRITDVVSAAADLHRVIKPALEEASKPVPTRREGVLKARSASPRPFPKADQLGNIVKFPKAN